MPLDDPRNPEPGDPMTRAFVLTVVITTLAVLGFVIWIMRSGGSIWG